MPITAQVRWVVDAGAVLRWEHDVLDGQVFRVVQDAEVRAEIPAEDYFDRVGIAHRSLHDFVYGRLVGAGGEAVGHELVTVEATHRRILALRTMNRLADSIIDEPAENDQAANL